MAGTNRFGNAVLALGAAALTALMAYTLIGIGHDGSSRARPSDADRPEILAVFLDRADWQDVRQAITACSRKGLLRVVKDEDDSEVVAGTRTGREVRFSWVRARGEGETRAEIRSRASGDAPPLAVIGSSNTALTVAVARALRDAGPDRSPVLLIPWATAVQADNDRGTGTVRLLDIHVGRSFRFCPDNRREAGLVVGCVADRAKGPAPGRVFVVVDPSDPFSADLSACFREAIRSRFPAVPMAVCEDVPLHAGHDDFPSTEDRRWARGLVDSSRDLEGPAWVVLPLQKTPALRLIRALRAAEAAKPGGLPVVVLCGDAIPAADLAEFAGSPGLAVWSASAASEPGSSPNAPGDAQVPAEIVAAVIAAVDRDEPPTPESVQSAIAGLDLKPGSPSAMGRPLKFAEGGERIADGLGSVLEAGPGSGSVRSFVEGRSGSWIGPSPVPPSASEALK